MTTSGRYTADRASLQAHPVPQWFADARFGVFIHWGLYSVPGFAPTKPFADVLRDDYDRAMVRSPYAEDYANALRDPSSPTAEYHRKTYGDLPYEGFQRIFEREVADFDADNWAETFQRAGADYVVMVAKYHDGYSMWPTKVRNPNAPDWNSDRDLVGEVATAVRARGIRFGIYYSGGVDWTFQREIVETLVDDITPPAVPHADFTTPEYTQYETTQDFAWETTRGMGTSYGYNRQEDDTDYASFGQTLFPDFVSAVAKNGRLLLNVGPAGGRGRIPPEQRSRLEAFGAWLDANGEAVRGTRPYDGAGATTADGLPVWFTQAPGRVNAIVAGRPTGATVRIMGVELPAAPGRLLSDGSMVTVKPPGGSTVLTFGHDLDGTYAPAVAIQAED
jgi:alpha-L-fucosidase